MTLVRRVTILFASALALGCADVLSPVRGDRYVLKTIGEEVLPAPDAPHSAVVIVAETLLFVIASPSQGLVRHRQVVQHSGITETWSFERTFEREGDALLFRVPCPINGLCAFNSYDARVDGSSLSITYPRIYLERRYARVR